MTSNAAPCVVCETWLYDAMVCDSCRSHLRGDLAELVDEYAMLGAAEPVRDDRVWTYPETYHREAMRGMVGPSDPVAADLPTGPVPGATGSPRVSGTRPDRIPARLDVLNLLGPGSAHVHVDRTDEHDDQIGELPPLTWLASWCRDWRDARDQAERLPDGTVTAMTRWLDRRIDWASAHHPAVGDFAAELQDQLRILRGVNRAGEKPEQRRVGPCPQPLDDGTVCRSMLYMQDRIDFIVCTRCGAEWQRRNWPWLFRAVAGVDERTA